MEQHRENEEQSETTPLLNTEAISKEEITPSTPLIEEENSDRAKKSVRTKIPEVELHVYRQGKGPVSVMKSSLGGWDQDQLEVRDILEQFGFKSIYAYNPNDGGRGVPIRFHPRNGRSILPYKDGSVIYIDGEPKVNFLRLLFLFFLSVYDCD